MKRKILRVTSALCVVFLIIAVVFFFLMKSAEPKNNTEEEWEGYDVSHIIENIGFLKFNTYDEIEKYAEEYPIYIQASDDNTLFGIGELYIEEVPVKLFYSLNEDGSLFRFDGYYTSELEKSDVNSVWNKLGYLDYLLLEYFDVEYFDRSIYDENGMPIDPNTDESVELLFEGKAKYSVTVVDEQGTYWSICALVTDKKQMDIEFFRCFDSELYDDSSLNIDLRVEDESGVE